jgi:prolyl oligopeptidase
MSIVKPTRTAPDDDPSLWLEEIEGARTLAWVGQQSAATLARFGHAGFAADRKTLTQIMDRAGKLPVVARRGAHLYNVWVDETHPRGLWRRTTLASFRTPTPAWDSILDVDALAAKEGEDWIWQGATTLPGTHNRAILRLSRGDRAAAPCCRRRLQWRPVDRQPAGALSGTF